MADWSKPLSSLADLYVDFRRYISDRLDDAAKMFDSATTTPTNQPIGTKRWNSTANKFEKWSGSAWSDLASTYGISISGNAATATTAATAGSVTTVTSVNITSGLGYTPANIASPTFTGLPKAPTAAAGTNTTQLATTAFVSALGALKAPVANPSFTGSLYCSGQIAANNAALRANGWGGVVTNGVVYFGNADSYIYKNGNTFQLSLQGVGTATITKGGTVAMTSDIPAAGIPYGVGSDSVGATIMAIYSGSGAPAIDTDVSGGYLTPCNTAGTALGSVRSGTWRCRGNTSLATNKITTWFKIA